MEKKYRLKIAVPLLGTLLFAVCLLSLRYGSADMSWKTFFQALADSGMASAESLILRYVRLPRMLGALLAGAGLSLSGLLLQSITDNAMASPSLVGVNAGSGFLVVIALSFLPISYMFLPLFAFLGALGAAAFIVAFSAKMEMKKSTVVLTGLAVNAVFSAGISFFAMLDTDVLTSYNAFSVGSLSSLRLSELLLPAVFIAVALLAAFLLAHPLSLLTLGDQSAKSLGVNVGMLRFFAMLAAALSSAAVVSFAGLLGFVGLMAPHIARRLFGGAFSRLLLPTLLIGALLVSLADLFGRILLAPSEIPVGILMALLGAPFFLFLLLKGDRALSCERTLARKDK